MFLRRLGPLGAAALLALSGAADAPAAESPPDSAAAIRGTERPLPRQASTLQYVGRGLLFGPWVAVRVATWPVVKLAEAEDRAHALSALADLLSFGYERGPFRSTLFFGYETNLGFSLVGLDATAMDWPQPGAMLRFSGGFLSDDENLVAAHFRSAPRALQWEALARVDNKPKRLFHGLGPDSDEEDFEAQRRRLLVEASVALRPAQAWKAALTGYARRDDLATPEDEEDEAVAVGFPEEFARAKSSDYHGAEAELAWDSRDREAFATRGSLVRVAGGTNVADSDGDADYRHWLGEVQTHVDLWRGNRLLALRAVAEGVVSDDPERIPYTELVRLGGKTGMRGYSRDRFTDRTGMLLTAEYHYPVTTRMHGSLFVDWGTVAARADELRLADIEPSVGLGVAYVIGDNGFTAHVARGEEGFQFFLGTETVFQSRSRRVR